MVAHTCHGRQEDQEFKASPTHRERPYLTHTKKKTTKRDLKKKVKRGINNRSKHFLMLN
jgi:hypothetical protein